MTQLVITENSAQRIVSAIQMAEGDGAEVQRLFPLRAGRMHRDPFVLFDHFYLQAGTGFPTHPHRGFEAITYLFTGSMQHKDNLGNDSTVAAGGAQRFTAGRGIAHSEMPHGTSSGIQLWINLPLRLKNIDAAYQALNREDIPVKMENGVEVSTIVGQGSPLQLHTEIEYLSIKFTENVPYPVQLKEANQGLVYVVAGKVELNGQTVVQGDAMYLDGNLKAEMTADNGAHVMLCMGTPHNEPIHQYGPYVD